MDCPALAYWGLGVSMSDEVVVLEEQDPHSVDGQDSAKTGCSSVAAKRCWVSGHRVCNCELDRGFECTGLEVCKRTTM